MKRPLQLQPALRNKWKVWQTKRTLRSSKRTKSKRAAASLYTAAAVPLCAAAALPLYAAASVPLYAAASSPLYAAASMPLYTAVCHYFTLFRVYVEYMQSVCRVYVEYMQSVCEQRPVSEQPGSLLLLNRAFARILQLRATSSTLAELEQTSSARFEAVQARCAG